MFIFLFLVVAITVSGYYYYRQQKKAVIRDQINQLQAIADLKSTEIENWLGERLGDARMIAGSPTLISDLLSYINTPTPGPRQESIRKWMASLGESYQYQNILLFDASRKIVLALSEEHPAVGAAEMDILEAAQRRKDAVISDLLRSTAVPFPHLEIVLPLLAGKRVAGFVLLRIDPANYLFPKIQAWPTPSPSAETLLAERQGDDVLFLNELRHRPGTAMKLRLPIRTPGLPAAMAVAGRTEPVLGRDYRGVAVWSVGRPVAGTSWFIVAKIDREEIERPVRRSALWMSIFVLSLVLAAALLILFLWQRQNIRSRLHHVAALRESEDKFKYVFDNSMVGKSITLPDGEINVNKAFCNMLGYSSKELQAKKWQQLTYADDVESTQKSLEKIISGKESSVRFEKRYLHKNGSIVWADVSTTLRRDAEGKPLYFMTSVVDITERKRAEDTLRKVIDNAPFGAHLYDLQPLGRLVFVGANRAADTILGVDNRKFIGKTIEEAFPLLGQTDIPDAYRRAAANGERFDSEQVEFAEGGIRGAFEVHAFQTSPNRMATFFFDITERKQAEAKLQREQALYMDLVNALPAGMYRLRVKPDVKWSADNWRSQMGSQYLIDFVSDRFCEITGIDRQEFIANPGLIPDRIHPDDSPGFAQKNAAAILSLSTFSWEGRMIVPDKGTTWIRFESIPRPLENGEVIWTGIVNDISERKLTEEILLKNERRLRETQEMARLGHWQWDVKTGKVEWSKEVFRIFQLDAENFTPQIDSILALSPWPEDHQRDTELIHRAMKTHEKGTYEQRFLRPDNSIGYYHSTFQGIYDAGGDLVSIIGTVLDISERKRAELDLQSVSARNQAMLEAIPDIIMEVDTNKVYTWANHAGMKFFGADVLGHEAAFYFEGEQRIYLQVQPIFNGKEDVVYIESWQRRHDGEKRLLAWWCRVLKDAGGHVVGALSTARDITEIKLAEIEIRQLNEELEHRVQQRTAQLQAANKELEAFSYSVSHDLRAPLRAIDGFSRILLEEYAPKLDDEGRRLLGVIRANTGKMGKLIDDLLAFSRLSRQKMSAAPVNLAAMAAAVFAELKSLEKGRRIEFKIGELPAARGDHSMLQQVLQNLLANAVKFTRTRKSARIEFGGKAGEGETIFHVKDNGVGFDAKYADKLFGVFQRLHSADEFEGTGVGLAIVQRIVLRHGGRIWAESSAKGAIFYFSLPAEPGSITETPSPATVSG